MLIVYSILQKKQKMFDVRKMHHKRFQKSYNYKKFKGKDVVYIEILNLLLQNVLNYPFYYDYWDLITNF